LVAVEALRDPPLVGDGPDVARSSSSGIEERTVSSAGSLAFASKSNSPSPQARAETTASSPAPVSPVAWKRCPKRK
jgi:hypothetical protein